MRSCEMVGFHQQQLNTTDMTEVRYLKVKTRMKERKKIQLETTKVLKSEHTEACAKVNQPRLIEN